MYRSAIAAALGIALCSSSAVAQIPERGYIEMTPATLGLNATTPSRIASSAREMNRDRQMQWSVARTPREVRRAAERAILQGGLQCSVVEAAFVAELLDNTPVVEVACAEGPGFMIANADPIMSSSCLVMATSTGALGPCRIRRNVELVTAARP
jgi:hypothetical protein